MKCKKVRRKLVAYLDGELKEKQNFLIEEHLSKCAECRKEVDLLSRTFYFLKNQEHPKLPEDFEANLWRRIYSQEKRQVTPQVLRRPVYLILSAAVAAALIIGVVLGNFLGKVIPSQNVNLEEEEYLTSIGLDNFQDLPPGSLPQVYFNLATQQR